MRGYDFIKTAIIDADLIYNNNKPSFPNLALMKLSAHNKLVGYETELKTDYKDLQTFDKVYLSKVFTETEVPSIVLKMQNVSYGGTGFYYDKAPFLSNEIEHIKPDYTLYQPFYEEKMINGMSENKLKYYKNYSIGFTTRFCFRGCKFCVNQNFKQVEKWSELTEFVDDKHKKIAMLDDNILGYPDHYKILAELMERKKPYQYRQGIDIRLLNDKNAYLLSKSVYDGDYMFSFDDIDDTTEIEEKIKLWRKHTGKQTKFCVLCGFDKNGRYDYNFWYYDIISIFERIKILLKYDCLPYIMRYNKYKESPFYGSYVNIASWCNQPALFKKFNYEDFCLIKKDGKNGKSATFNYCHDLKTKHREIADIYYKLQYGKYV